MLWISVMSLLVVAGVAVWQRRRWPALAASLAAYAVILSPVLGFVQSGPQLVADRYSYLSCMGFALVGGAILLRCRRRESWWARRRPSYVLGLIVAVLVVALHRATFAQNDVWRDPLTLWTQGVRVSPDSAVANVNMADALVSFLLHGAAVPFYKRALELNPDDPVAHHHLADVYKYFGDAGAAIYHYRRALQIDPDRPRACYSLAELFNGTGRGDLAVIVLRDGAQRRPDALRLIDYLARLLASHPDAKVRNGEEALRWAEHAIRLSGADHVPSLMTMAVAEAELGRFDAAIETAERALTLAEAAEADLLIHRLTRRLAIFRQGRPYRMNQ